MAGDPRLAVDAESSQHPPGSIGVERRRHAVRLRSANRQRKVFAIRRQPFHGHPRGTRHRQRSVWRNDRQRDGDRVLVRISYYCDHYQAWEILQVAKRENHLVKSYENEMVITRVEPQLDHFRVAATNSDNSPATFGVNLTVAKYFGLVKESRAGGYVLGHNARFGGYPTFEHSRRQRRVRWPIETDMTATTDAIVVKKLSNGEDMVFFSRYLDWAFSNLSRSFQDVTRLHKTQLALVYCDLVESSLVGNQKHALLRQIMLKDSGGHRQSTEPLHYQWLGVRNNVIEVVHVQVADADGRLLSLPSGKTMVTVILKRSS